MLEIIKDKENQIEEMAMIMCENDCEECRRESIEFYGNSYEEETQCVFNAGAEKLYEQGYRKLPEDSVVLSKEEYERLKGERKLCNNCGTYFQSAWSECPKCGTKPSDIYINLQYI